MTPGQARGVLDAWLQKAGQDITLERMTSANPPYIAASVSAKAHIVDFKPADIDGARGLQIGDSHVIMSNTEITAAEWPAAGESPIPRKGDRIIVAGRTRLVLYGWAAPYISGELVRIELAIR